MVSHTRICRRQVQFVTEEAFKRGMLETNKACLQGQGLLHAAMQKLIDQLDTQLQHASEGPVRVVVQERTA